MFGKLLSDKRATIKASTAILMMAVLAFSAVGLLYATGNLSFDTEVTPTEGKTTDPSDLTAVTKQLKLVVNDKHGGAPATGTTNSIDIYREDGENTWETDLDLSSGAVTTGLSYKSNTVLYIQYYYDTTIDEYMWWKVTVPEMTKADAESLTANTISLEAFSSPAATDLMHIGTTAYADGANLNVTGTTNDTGTFQYSWSITTSGTGFISSYDPIYDTTGKAVLWASLTGTGYETVSLTGWDAQFTLGSTKYYYKTLADSQVSKWAIGNTYKDGYDGADSFSFAYNAVGLSGNSTVLQVTLSLYADVNYMKENGAWGPYVFTLCESTVNFLQL